MKADIIGVRLSDSRQVVFLEMSGAPTDFLKAHPIGDTYRLTLRTIFLRGKEDYVDEEEFSAVFPLSWDFRFQFIEIFELMEFVVIYILEYSDIIRELIKHPATSDEIL
ncbi:2972_t:CDS:2 [Acaulospora colombiana]|uniref:2972_t:CDS:1 n=1 Tax=Acaulospora colombiana TaxID=27376 RepID=A0ACA9LK72_9GLOM|nr:2972_t:CDS:2 [Acaulospora colombiana]